MPGDDEVDHLHGLFAAVLLTLKLLTSDGGSQVLEVFLDNLLLFLHRFRTADARAEVAKLLEVLERPCTVELSRHHSLLGIFPGCELRHLWWRVFLIIRVKLGESWRLIRSGGIQGEQPDGDGNAYCHHRGER